MVKYESMSNSPLPPLPLTVLIGSLSEPHPCVECPGDLQHGCPHPLLSSRHQKLHPFPLVLGRNLGNKKVQTCACADYSSYPIWGLYIACSPQYSWKLLREAHWQQCYLLSHLDTQSCKRVVRLLEVNVCQCVEGLRDAAVCRLGEVVQGRRQVRRCWVFGEPSHLVVAGKMEVDLRAAPQNPTSKLVGTFSLNPTLKLC